MESHFEQILIYGIAGIFLAGVIIVYVRKLNRESKIVEEKIP